MEIDDVLENFGELDKTEHKNLERWYELVTPSTVNIILGRKGKGKSALAYFLLENAGEHYGLAPVVVNLPLGKRSLLPETFLVRSLEEVKSVENSIVLIDEGTTMLHAGQAKLEEMVKGFQALSRQRNQIVVLVFHASSDVGSRILRGVDAVLLKEPSLRQIQHGSKDSWWHDLLLEAKGKFRTLAELGEDARKYTYVDSEEPEFRGLLLNPLPSFWSEDLSCAWAGASDSILTSAKAAPGLDRNLTRLLEGLCLEDANPFDNDDWQVVQRYDFNKRTTFIYENKVTGQRKAWDKIKEG